MHVLGVITLAVHPPRNLPSEDERRASASPCPASPMIIPIVRWPIVRGAVAPCDLRCSTGDRAGVRRTDVLDHSGYAGSSAVSSVPLRGPMFLPLLVAETHQQRLGIEGHQPNPPCTWSHHRSSTCDCYADSAVDDSVSPSGSLSGCNSRHCRFDQSRDRPHIRILQPSWRTA